MNGAQKFAAVSAERPPEYRYHMLRAAVAEQLPGLAGLDPRQLAAIARRADRSFELESLVLGSAEARRVVVPDAQLDQAVGEVAARYDDGDAFLADLEANGLDPTVLRRALWRELAFDACMQRVAARRPTISELDERLFFDLHRERFAEPDQRTARHILVTVNDSFAENRREAARARIEALAERLTGRANRFPKLARRYSECPTAMQDGRLGSVTRGQLYPALDAELFALEEGGISAPVESELGFHLLWCERVRNGRSLPFSAVRESIRRTLDARAARNCQKAWIGELRRAAGQQAG